MVQIADALVPPAQEEAHLKFHFSPGLRVGDAVYLSGQIGMDADGTPLADAEEQFVKAFENVKEVLALAGCGFEDVAELVTYHAGFDELEAFIAIKDRYITGPVFPCWTAVGAALMLPGALVEIKCTAIRKAADVKIRT